MGEDGPSPVEMTFFETMFKLQSTKKQNNKTKQGTKVLAMLMLTPPLRFSFFFFSMSGMGDPRVNIFSEHRWNSDTGDSSQRADKHTGEGLHEVCVSLWLFLGFRPCLAPTARCKLASPIPVHPRQWCTETALVQL